MTPRLPSPARRRGLVLGAAATLAAGWPLPRRAVAQAAPDARIALLIGNRDYPEPQDLPSMRTNAERLGTALRALDFEVTLLTDLQRAASLQALEAFGRRLRALPPNGTSLFYFCGHGMQIDAENFLLPSGIYPRFRPLDESNDVYVALQRQVLLPWPTRPAGQTITVVDACRVSPKPLDAVRDDGLNQTRVREGELVVFSTRAGRPALAPIDPDRLTFFTGELVRQLERQAREPEELSFRDLFRSVAFEVHRTMLNHPVEALRQLAQEPFLADNMGSAARVSRRPPPAPDVAAAASAPDPAAEQRALEAIGQALWPADVVRLTAEFGARFPASRFGTAARVAGEGARTAAGLLRHEDTALFRRDFEPRPELGPGFQQDLSRAARGDKDAAARVGVRLLRENPRSQRRSFAGWMAFAADLGNGIAAYDLAKLLLDDGMPDEAANWQKRAGALGYVIPPSLRLTR
jgi:hypothetical protein